MNMTLNQLVNACGNAKAKAEKAEKEFKELRALLINAMLEEGKEEVITGQHKAIYKMIAKSSIDTTALKKALPEVAQSFMKTTQSEYFRVF